MASRATALACLFTVLCWRAPAAAEEPTVIWATEDGREPASHLGGPLLHLSVGAGFGAVRPIVPELDGRGSGANFAPQLRFAYLHPISPSFALGGAVHGAAWQSDFDEALGNGDSYLAGALFVAELRAVRPEGRSYYVRGELGPAFELLSTDVPFEQLREDASLGVGVYFEASIGMQVLQTRHFGFSLGASLGIGYLWHELEVQPAGGEVARYDARYALSSLGIEAGLVFPL